MEENERKTKIKKFNKKHDKKRRRNLFKSETSFGKRNILQYFINIFADDNNQEFSGNKKFILKKLINLKNFCILNILTNKNIKKFLQAKMQKKNLLFKLLIIILLFFIAKAIFKCFYNNNDFEDDNYVLNIKLEDDEISIIINMKNLATNKHTLFYNITQKFNTTRNY